MMSGRELERPLSGRSVVDVIAARLQVRRQRALQLRLVVDHEHAVVRGHVSTGIVTTIVVPPPGVSSM